MVVPIDAEVFLVSGLCDISHAYLMYSCKLFVPCIFSLCNVMCYRYQLILFGFKKHITLPYLQSIKLRKAVQLKKVSSSYDARLKKFRTQVIATYRITSCAGGYTITANTTHNLLCTQYAFRNITLYRCLCMVGKINIGMFVDFCCWPIRVLKVTQCSDSGFTASSQHKLESNLVFTPPIGPDPNFVPCFSDHKARLKPYNFLKNRKCA